MYPCPLGGCVIKQSSSWNPWAMCPDHSYLIYQKYLYIISEYLNIRYIRTYYIFVGRSALPNPILKLKLTDYKYPLEKSLNQNFNDFGGFYDLLYYYTNIMLKQLLCLKHIFCTHLVREI